jgi:hypothetical protein
LRGKLLNFKELTAEQRRIAVDAIQHFLDLRQEYQEFRGGLHWKQVGSREYLIKTLDRVGHQQSLGPRSPKTEETLRRFTERKKELREQIKALAGCGKRYLEGPSRMAIATYDVPTLANITE